MKPTDLTRMTSGHTQPENRQLQVQRRIHRYLLTDYLQVDPIKGGPSGGHDSKPARRNKQLDHTTQGTADSYPDSTVDYEPVGMNEIPAGHVRALEAIV